MIKPTANRNKLFAGVTYLILFFGIVGWATDAIIYVIEKDKHIKLHAGQSCFLALIITMLSLISMALTFPITIYDLTLNLTTIIVAVIVSVIYVMFAISVFIGKDIQIPFIVRIVEKK